MHTEACNPETAKVCEMKFGACHLPGADLLRHFKRRLKVILYPRLYYEVFSLKQHENSHVCLLSPLDNIVYTANVAN